MTAFKYILKTGLCLSALLALGAHAQQQGVSKDELEGDGREQQREHDARARGQAIPVRCGHPEDTERER